MTYIFIYTTFPEKKTATRIIKGLLKSRLIACANIFPITSIYRWNSSVKTGKEVTTILKTGSLNFKRVRQELIDKHPYKIPCIAKIDIKANIDYEKWMKNEISNKR